MRETEDEEGEKEDGDAEDAAFGAYGSSGVEGLADGVGGEETALHEAAAVGDAVEEGLAPVPGHVEADAPPQRAGAPESDDEDNAGQEDLEEAQRGLSGVARVGVEEECGGEDGGDPEGDGAGALWRDEIADRDQAAGEGELDVAAEDVLLGEADEEEGEELEGAPVGDGGAVVEAGVEGEEMEAVQGEDEQGDGGDAPEGSDEQAAEGVGSAEAEGGEAAMLEDGHESADQQEDGEESEFADDHGGEKLGGGLVGCGSGRLGWEGFDGGSRGAGLGRDAGGGVLDRAVGVQAEEEEAADYGKDDCEVDQETPQGAQTEGSEEEVRVRRAVVRGRSGRRALDGRRVRELGDGRFFGGRGGVKSMRVSLGVGGAGCGGAIGV